MRIWKDLLWQSEEPSVHGLAEGSDFPRGSSFLDPQWNICTHKISQLLEYGLLLSFSNAFIPPPPRSSWHTVFPTVAAAEIPSHVLHSLFQAWEIIPSKYTIYFPSKLCNNSLVPAVDQTLGHSNRNGPGHFWERWCDSGSLWAVLGSQSPSSCGRSLPGAPLMKEGRSGSLCVRRGNKIHSFNDFFFSGENRPVFWSKIKSRTDCASIMSLGFPNMGRLLSVPFLTWGGCSQSSPFTWGGCSQSPPLTRWAALSLLPSHGSLLSLKAVPLHLLLKGLALA